MPKSAKGYRVGEADIKPIVLVTFCSNLSTNFLPHLALSWAMIAS
jgi:hypothetical protein